MKFETPYPFAYNRARERIMASDYPVEFDFAEKWGVAMQEEIKNGRELTLWLIHGTCHKVYHDFGANAPIASELARKVMVRYWIHGAEFGKQIQMSADEIMKLRANAKKANESR